MNKNDVRLSILNQLGETNPTRITKRFYKLTNGDTVLVTYNKLLSQGNIT